MSSDTATTKQVDNEPLQEEILTDHSYDGIQEYDNPLPGWWTWLFILTTIFAPLYLVYFHLGVNRSIHDQYDQQMARIFELRFKDIGDLEPNRETLVKYMNDPEWRNVGKVVFQANCVSCHAADGSGLVGPNLTDQYWKNVRKIEDIATVISEGAANGSMPAWKNRLSHQNLIVLTAAYIASMQENPLPGKEPDPEAVELAPWSTLGGGSQ
jgi:cytochrome c oxidase cbb3-type subunit 3